MDLLVVVLWILLGAAVIETMLGIKKRSGALIVIGLLVAVMCALGLMLAINFADSIYITGEGMPL